MSFSTQESRLQIEQQIWSMHTVLPLVGRSLAIFTESIVLMCLSIVVVTLRIIVRLYIIRAFGWDDGLMTIAMILFIASCITMISGSASGVGHHIKEFSNIVSLQKALQWWWLTHMFYTLSTTFTKLSIAVALLRLTVIRLHIWVLWLVMGLVIASGTCLSTGTIVKIAYLYSAISVVCDLTLGILPIFLVYRLQMERQMKIAVAGILSLGALASIAFIVRFMFLRHYRDADFLFTTYPMSLCSVTENGLGIIAGSLITLRPLFRWIHDKSRVCTLRQSYKENGSQNYELFSLRSPGRNYSNLSGIWNPDTGNKTIMTTITAPNRISSQSTDSQGYLRPMQRLFENHVSVRETIIVTEERTE